MKNRVQPMERERQQHSSEIPMKTNGKPMRNQCGANDPQCNTSTIGCAPENQQKTMRNEWEINDNQQIVKGNSTARKYK